MEIKKMLITIFLLCQLMSAIAQIVPSENKSSNSNFFASAIVSKKNNVAKSNLLQCNPHINKFKSPLQTIDLSADFETGDLTGWTPSAAGHWETTATGAISGSFSLHQTNTAASIDQISHAISLNFSETKVWRFKIKYNYDPSGTNNWGTFLFCDKDATGMQFTGGTENGYVLGVNLKGESDDLVRFYKVTNGTFTTALTMTSYNWQTSITSTGIAAIEVERSPAGYWKIKIDQTGTFANLIEIGSGTEATFTTASHFGFIYRYTLSAMSKLWLDDIYIGAPIPPTINEVEAISPTKLRIKYSKPVQQASAETLSNYTVNTSIGTPVSAVRQADLSVVELTFSASFLENTNYSIQVKNVSDETGSSAMITKDITFQYYSISVTSVKAIANNLLDVYFNKEVETITATQLTNYSVNLSIGNPSSATIDAVNKKLVHLTFTNFFQQSTNYILSYQNIKDLFNFTIISSTKNFNFYQQQWNDVTINEIMVDISPVPLVVPAQKYIELFNNTAFELDLTNWNLCIGTNTCATFPATTLASGGYLILCSSAGEADLKPFGKTLAILNPDFLSLSGKSISIFDSKSLLISTVNYSDTWYRNALKDDGGWSLEKIDPTNSCSEAINWKASDDYMGGTPGRKNSVFATNPDTQTPEIKEIKIIHSKKIVVVFTENLLSADAINLSNYVLNTTISPTKAVQFSNDNSQVELTFNSNFTIGNNTLVAKNIKDRCGNLQTSTQQNFSYSPCNAWYIQVMSNNELVLHFTEKLSKIPAQLTTNYSVNNIIGNPTIAILSADSMSVNLMFANNFSDRILNQITIQNLTDANGNLLTSQNLNFTYFIPAGNDVVINEIMNDVSPIPIALPAYPYIEIYNRNNFAIDLSGWKIQINGQTERTIGKSAIPANGYLIICSTEAENSFKQRGITSGILSSSDISSSLKKIAILDRSGKVNTTTIYSNLWFTDLQKKEGGWSMEKIDAENFCGTSTNWTASTDISGGTPGRKNSNAGSNIDNTIPKFVSLRLISSTTIALAFSEEMDENTALNPANFNISPTIGAAASITYSDSSQAVILVKFAAQFSDNSTYTVNVKNQKDKCSNSMSSFDQNFTYHRIAPLKIYVYSDHQLKIKFSEKVDSLSAELITKYIVNNGIGNPEISSTENIDKSQIHLQFATNFTDGTEYTISINGIIDLNGNVMNPIDLKFIYYAPKPFDVIFNEVMVDVSPVPAQIAPARYIELYNNSNYDIDLFNWTLLSEGQSIRVFPHDTIKAHGFLILSQMEEKDMLVQYGNVSGLLSSTDLSSTGKKLTLKDSKSILIDQLNYSDTWYKNDLKKDGGWSLERIDPLNYCSEISNWKACVNYMGGTPGRKNSVFGTNPDTQAPEIKSVKIINSKQLIISFSENINFDDAVKLSNYQLNSTTLPTKAVQFSNDQSQVQLTFNENFISGNNALLVKNFKDRCGNLQISKQINFAYTLSYAWFVQTMSNNEVVIYFTEKITKNSAQNLTNFSVTNSIGNPSLAILSADSLSINLFFSANFVERVSNMLTIQNILDLNGNSLASQSLPFTYLLPASNDLVVNEIMSDVSPAPMALPAYPYIELYNRNSLPIDLSNWKIQLNGQTEHFFKKSIIPANGYIIICASEAENLFKLQGNTAAILSSSDISSSLKTIAIIDNKGKTVTTSSYSNLWNTDSQKKEGGWSLEKIDADNFCGTSTNWSASTDITGGTPGRKNSNAAKNADISSPKFISFRQLSSTTLALTFSEELDENSAFNSANFNLIPSIGGSAVISFSDTSEAVLIIKYSNQFADNSTYSLTIKNQKDKCGNSMPDFNQSFTYYRIYPLKVYVTSDYQLKIKFSENIDVSSALNVTNYIANNSLGNPELAVTDISDKSIVYLQFSKKFSDGALNIISLSGIKDLNGNPVVTNNYSFTYYVPKPFDITFNEVMADISPVPANLPSARYIEIINNSAYEIDLCNWIFLSEGQTERVFSHDTIKAGGFLLLCESSSKEVLNSFGKTLGMLSSTDLTSTGKKLILKDSKQNTMDQISYTDTWYRNSAKKDGGWSLEKMNPKNNCTQSLNWKASTDVKGGTPGSVNSVFSNEFDNKPPVFITGKVIGDNKILLQFDEEITESSLIKSSFSLDHGIGNPTLITRSDTSNTTILLTFPQNFTDSTLYVLNIATLNDNCGNFTQIIPFQFQYVSLKLLKVYAESDKNLFVQFSALLDKNILPALSDFKLNNGMESPVSLIIDSKNNSIIHLSYLTSLTNKTNYKLLVNNIKALDGRIIVNTEKIFDYIGFEKNEIIINEVLYNPFTGGVDFVELYNKSEKNLDLKLLKIATRDSETKQLKSIYFLSDSSVIIAPKSFMVVTTDEQKVRNFYYSPKVTYFATISSMPSFSDDKGTVVILDSRDSVIDEMNYTDDMQFKLLKNTEGVALERINYDHPSSEIGNWHSAAETVGFATPGYKNSEYSEYTKTESEITLTNELFSPDNDGYNDFLSINFQFGTPGTVATVTIFDSKGRLIRRLLKEKLLETEGIWIWDGLNEVGNQVKYGIYLIFVETYQADGSTKKFKLSCVVAGK